MSPIFIKNAINDSTAKGFCTICNCKIKQFIPHGNPPRPKAKCPKCGSLERHRFSWKYITSQEKWLFPRAKILHICPEDSIEPLLKKIGMRNYHAIDLKLKFGCDHSALTSLDIEDNYFDFIYCSHVLEHIQNDTAAISEMFRTLKVGGNGIFVIPTKGDTTIYHESANTPEQRKELYGQVNRVRLYGKQDFFNKLVSAGFDVKIIHTRDLVQESEFKFFGFKNKFLYSVTKP
jgi:predicted SAM-dependent methyltransferase